MKTVIKTTEELIQYLKGDDFEDRQFARSVSSWDSITEDLGDLEIDRDELDEACNDKWDDDCGNLVWRFGTRFAHESEDGGLVLSQEETADPEAYFAGWDNDSYGSLEALLVSFDISPTIEEASDSDAGPFKIWCKPHYYYGTSNTPLSHWVAEDNDPYPMTFETYKEAQDWIEKTEDGARGYKSERNPHGSYLLSHGEYSSPSYTIAKA